MVAGLRIYIDDSGEKEYGDKTSRYFVYAGAVVDRANEQTLSDRIDELKEATFKTAVVEIKSNWLRIPSERKRRYLDAFGVSEEQVKSFVGSIGTLMESDSFTYVAAAIDKQQMLERYGTHAWYPSAAAYQFLLQRFQIHCSRLGAPGSITIDDMSGSSPKRNQWRALLRTHHERLKKDGCQLTKMTFPSMPKFPLFGSSKSFNLLQVADLVAYDVYRQFREYGEAWDKPNSTGVPIYPPLKPLLKRFMLGPTSPGKGVIEGWGIVKWPKLRDKSKRWSVKR